MRSGGLYVCGMRNIEIKTNNAIKRGRSLKNRNTDNILKEAENIHPIILIWQPIKGSLNRVFKSRRGSFRHLIQSYISGFVCLKVTPPFFVCFCFPRLFLASL